MKDEKKDLDLFDVEVINRAVALMGNIELVFSKDIEECMDNPEGLRLIANRIENAYMTRERLIFLAGKLADIIEANKSK